MSLSRVSTNEFVSLALGILLFQFVLCQINFYLFLFLFYENSLYSAFTACRTLITKTIDHYNDDGMTDGFLACRNKVYKYFTAVFDGLKERITMPRKTNAEMRFAEDALIHIWHNAEKRYSLYNSFPKNATFK